MIAKLWCWFFGHIYHFKICDGEQKRYFICPRCGESLPKDPVC